MNTECLRIADQLRRAFEGQAWHGPALRELLANVTAEQAGAHPLASAHSIWEIALHIDVYAQAALGVTQGVPMPKIYGTDLDWPSVTDKSPAAWKTTTGKLFHTAEQLSRAIEGFGDERLKDMVPGRSGPHYDFYYLFHGIAQHSLYHGGQIAMLKKI
jgi:hypothetical protein